MEENEEREGRENEEKDLERELVVLDRKFHGFSQDSGGVLRRLWGTRRGHVFCEERERDRRELMMGLSLLDGCLE